MHIIDTSHQVFSKHNMYIHELLIYDPFDLFSFVQFLRSIWSNENWNNKERPINKVKDASATFLHVTRSPTERFFKVGGGEVFTIR